MESSDAIITVGYDPYYIHSPESLVSATIKECNGDLLKYESVQSSSKQLVSFVCKIISLLAVILWLVGSYSHKLIGVETLHTIQLIFLMQAFAPRYRPVVIYFSQLQNTMNLFQGLLSSSTPLSSASYQRLNESSDCIYNQGLVIGLEILIIMAFVIVRIVRLQSSGSITLPHEVDKLPVEKIKKIQSFIYDFLLFPTLIGFFLSFTVSMEINSTPSIVKSHPNYSPVALGIFVAFSTSAIIFFEEWKCLFMVKKP